MTDTKPITENQLVLVTDKSGFVGVHCILQLLNAGVHVQTTTQPEVTARPIIKASVPCDQSKVKLGLLGDL